MGNDSAAVVLTTLLLCTQQNMMVFIAELFWWFETVKPDFVKPRDLQVEFKDGESRFLANHFCCWVESWHTESPAVYAFSSCVSFMAWIAN